MTTESSTYQRMILSRNHYYEALQINVTETGNYTFISVSRIDTYGYLFINDFDPTLVCKTLIAENDDAKDDNLQFQIQYYLQSSIMYILVVTTYFSNTTGKFSIVVEGPGNANIVRIENIQSSNSKLINAHISILKF